MHNKHSSKPIQVLLSKKNTQNKLPAFTQRRIQYLKLQDVK